MIYSVKNVYFCGRTKCDIMQPIERLNLTMLNVGFAQHDGDWNWQNVSSPFTRIYYVTKGSAKLHLQSETFELQPHNLYIIPQNTLHSYECCGTFEHFYLHVYEKFKEETDIFDYYDFPACVKAEVGDEELFRNMCSLHPEAALPTSDPSAYDNNTMFMDYVGRYNSMSLYEKMYLRGVTLIFFSRFMRCATPRLWTRDERMKRVLEYINRNLYEEIDIESLATVACVTSTYLIRLFKMNLNVTPLKYITQKKVERAKLLLLTEDISIKELAYKIGFNDVSYFVRLFRSVTGTTPQQYRLKMRS